MSKQAVGAPVGKVTNYLSKINVAIIELSAPLKAGDKIAIVGATTDFQQTVKSMQIEHEAVESAKSGQAIGLKVKDRVRPGDTVYRL